MKTATGAKTDEEKVKERLENEAFKLEYVNQERDCRLRDVTLELCGI